MADLEKKSQDIIDLIDEGQWEHAERALETLGNEELTKEKALWRADNLGFVKYRLGKIKEAIGWCDCSLEMDPEHAYAHKGKGICLAAQGRLDEGIRSMLKAIQCNPSFFDAYHDLAVILMEAGDPTQAKPWAQRAYQLDPVGGEPLLRSVLSAL